MVDILLEENVLVPMCDNISIAADVFRPDVPGKFPALLSMSPYGKEMQRYPGGHFSSVEAGPTKHFVSHGYAHVIADSRGSAPSGGQWALSSAEEQQDGYELVEWIAQQPWCNGSVAMVGGSYYAQIQFLVAATQPPHLKTIVPFNGWTDIYRDLIFHGGLLHGFFPVWLSSVYERVQAELGSMAPEKWLPPRDVLGDVVARNPTDGPYYWERGITTRFDKIKVPVYHMLSTSTYNHYRSQLVGYTKLSCPQKLMIIAGSLRRAIYHEAIAAEIVRWLDYWMKDIDTGIMKEPPVTVFVQGSDEWRYELEYPLKRTEWTKLYLHSGADWPASQPPYGRLGRDLPGAEPPDAYDYPESDAAAEANLPVVAYCTPPASEDREHIGPASLTLYASSSVADAAWIVRIDDVAPDGAFKMISKGWLRASHREVDEARSSSGIPFHPHTKPSPLEPNRVYKFEIEIWPLCRNFKAGHQLRLRIASSDSRAIDVGNFHSVVEQPARLTIHHSKDYPSHLLLPLIPRATPTALKPKIDYKPKY